MLFIPILIVFIATIISITWWQNRTKRELYNELKCKDLKCWPIFGHIGYFLGSNEEHMDSFDLLGEKAAKSGGSICVWLLNKLVYVTADPIDAEFILTSCLEKDDPVKLMQCVGTHLLLAPVSIWKPRRKAMSPMFSVKRLSEAVQVQLKHGQLLARSLEPVVGTNFSIWNHVAAYSMDSVGEAILGVEMRVQENQGHPFLDALVANLASCAARIAQPMLHNDFIFQFTRLYSTMVNSSEFLKDYVKRQFLEKCEMMENGKETNSDRPKSVMERLIYLTKQGKGFTEEDLLEEMVGFTMAAIDTTSVSITCTLWLLARHPEVQEKLYNELRDYYGDLTTPVRGEDFPSLKYLDAVLKESLRLFPAAPITMRKVTQPLILPSGKKLIPGMGTVVQFRSVQRNQNYWGPDAEEFKPERFLKQTPHVAFMPFGKGPRTCLGFLYAQTSIKVALVNVLRRYRFTVAPGSGKTIKLKFDITARPVDSHLVQVELRK